MKKIFASIFIAAMLFPSMPSVSSAQEESMVKMWGAYGASLGLETDQFLWKDANGDYQEKNFRYVDQYDGVNTYDKRIFDRYQLFLETDTQTPWNAFAEIKIDPWTFVGVGNQTASSAWNDRITVKYKYWENTGKTINETYRTFDGNSVGVPEMKVIGGRVVQQIQPVGFQWVFGLQPAPFTLSPNNSIEIDRLYRPVRKAWIEYKEDPLYIKIFPIADQAEAFTSDDPFHISNNHVYWAPSPWLFYFYPGMELRNGIELAEWRWDLTWFAEDSNRNFLTFLRGITMVYNYNDTTTFNITAASPMTLWDYYEDVNSVPIAMRFKTSPSDKLTVGSTYTVKYGLFKQELLGSNQAMGVDATYNLFGDTDLFGEYVTSYTNIVHPVQPGHRRIENVGFAYKGGLKSKYEIDATNSLKWDVSFASMDKDFQAGLADYRDTRLDRDWGQHIWFDPITPDDEAIRIGDSIDINRYVLGANARARLLDNLFDIYFNFRNARNTYNDKFIENIVRLEGTFNPLSNIQIKGLALDRIYHNTIGDFDPILRDRYTDDFFRSYEVGDGNKVEVMTFSGGVKVDLLPDKLSVYGIYEATNDPQDFPRGILNNTAFNQVITVDNINVNRLITQVYRQDLFALPPFGFYNIWKGVVSLRPIDNLGLKYSHVTNGNRNYAALFDNNQNHDGIELDCTPIKNVTIRCGYTLSRIMDLRRAVDTAGIDRKFEAHHNIYAEANWKFKKDQLLTVQFGEAWLTDLGTGLYATRWPSTKVSVLDTRDIVRVFFQGKF